MYSSGLRLLNRWNRGNLNIRLIGTQTSENTSIRRIVMGTGKTRWSTVVVREEVTLSVFSQRSITIYRGFPFSQRQTLGDEITLIFKNKNNLLIILQYTTKIGKFLTLLKKFLMFFEYEHLWLTGVSPDYYYIPLLCVEVPLAKLKKYI